MVYSVKRVLLFGWIGKDKFMRALLWMRLVCMSTLMVVALHSRAAENALELQALQFNAY